MQKMAHERMLDGQGRKLVKQRMGDQTEEHDLYRNLREDQGGEFDSAWNRKAQKMGMGPHGSLGYAQHNAIGHGGGHHNQRQVDNGARAEARGLAPPEKQPVHESRGLMPPQRDEVPTMSFGNGSANQRRRAGPPSDQARSSYQATNPN